MKLNGQIAISFIILILLYSTIYSSSPHKRLTESLQTSAMSDPYYLQNIDLVLQKGVNSTSILPDGSRPYSLITPPDSLFNALAIVVQFSDNIASINATFFDSLLFASGTGTLKDYYLEVSYGRLTILTINLPSSIGWLTASQTYAYYVNGENGFGSYPQNAQRLTEDIVALADPYVDFSPYDNNADGYVDALFIIHSGPGAEYTGNSNDIWSHKWSTSSPQLVDGVYVYTYSMEPEYWQTPGDMTCGVYAHEMGHSVFGLPDLYDRDGSSRGLGRWSLMAGGSWNGNLGDSPAHPDAWSRYQMGYSTPHNVTQNETSVMIPAIENDTTIYRLWTEGDMGSEYFLIENREPVGYDAALPGFGMLTYHIDESVASQNDDENHYLVALEQADGNYNLENDVNSGDTGDPFPGINQNRIFDNNSIPNSRNYLGSNTLVAISNISDAESIMTADFEVSETVIYPPDIAISANELTFNMLEGTTTDSVLIISNVAQPGSQDLNWEINEENMDFSWISENPTSGTIQPEGSQQVDLFIDGSQLSGGIYYCNLIVSSNDPDENLLSIPVTLHVEEVNHPPVLSQISNQFLAEGIIHEVSLYAFDPDNDNLSFQIDGLPSFGNLLDHGDGTGTITFNPGFDDSGTYENIEVMAFDDGSPILSDTVYFNLNIINSNRSPIAVNDSAVLFEDTSKTIYVLENDSDPDNDQLGLLNVFPPKNGNVLIDWIDSYIIYTPSDNYYGTDSVEYVVHDGKSGFDTAMVYITIQSRQDLPVAMNDRLTIYEDSCQTLNVLVNDYDIDEDLLSINHFNLPASGMINLLGDSLINYCPNPNFFGRDSFLYTITDGKNGFDSALVTITVLPLPDSPIARDDSVAIKEDSSVTINILKNDSDPDGDTIFLKDYTNPLNGIIYAVLGDTALVYQPSENFFGNDTLYYYIEDGTGLRDTARILIRIDEQNDLPYIALPDSFWIITNECDSLNLWDLVIDEETADSLLKYKFSISPDTIPLIFNPYSGYLTLFATNTQDYSQYILCLTVIDQNYAQATDSMLILIRQIDEIEVYSTSDIPIEYKLQQNYPNPFNPITYIDYWLPKSSEVKIEVYNIIGQKVKTLINSSMKAGKYQVKFDANNLPSGIYFYRIMANEFNDVKKMILVR